MLTADWFLLGRDTYYRKFEIYSMGWQHEVNMDNVIASGSPYGGPIAIIRDNKKFIKVQGTGKPVITIYSGSGKQISSIVWNRGQPVALGWSDREHLLCVQDDGSVCIHDMFGSYQHMFHIGLEAYETEVIDARIFSSLQGTGVVILTSSFKVFLVNNVYEPKKRQLCDLPNSDVHPGCWGVIPGDRHTEVILARGKDLYYLKEDEPQCVKVLPDISHKYNAILDMAVSHNARHVALFTDAGYLWMGSVDFRTKYCEVRTDCEVRPKQLVWCGTEAVVLYDHFSVMVFSRQAGDVVGYAYDGAIHLVPEIDGVRILSSAQHEMVQKVPTVVQKIFRINSTDPGSFLLEASKQYQKRSHRADEYISLVKNDLELAVQQCVEAAGYEFDTDTQKMLIRAAQFGKCFIAEPSNPEGYVAMCRLLRVLNAVRDTKIGIPLTCLQVDCLTYRVLLDRLVNRKHFYLAIQIAKFLRLAEHEGCSRILSRWAGYKVMQNHLDEDAVAREIADKVGYTSGVSYSEIALTAANCGRKQLAIKLLDYEPRARLQVPLLLQLGEGRPALLKAIESGDTDLMHTVILHMRENMPLADFRMTIRNFPVAQALYKKYCLEHNYQAFVEIHIQEDDFGSQADAQLRDGLDPGNVLMKEASLLAAQEAYRKGRNDLHAALCDEAVRLLRAQKILDETYAGRSDPLVGQSVHDTCSILLAMNELKAADRFRAEFKIPERRYWWLRIGSLADLQDWPELERLSKSKKSPIGYGPFVDACLQRNNNAEALKYLPRLSEDLQLKYYTRAGLADDAARMAFELKKVEGQSTSRGYVSRYSTPWKK